MPSPPPALSKLVEQFDEHRDQYRSTSYNEAQLRQEFLNPFLEALGWDVYNKQNYSEAYKEVIHEASIKMGGLTKAPDYALRAGGGVTNLFIEAKKPSVDIKGEPAAAFQLRRYAWSAKLPLSILTDFEELAVYDCRVRPIKTDKASTARVIYLTYDEYEQHWDTLHGLFSPEAIRHGSLDKFVASKKIKKGTAQVDDAFLDEIETWRTALARNIALRNKNLSQRDLNFAVQRTIDRIIFLRICEDRGIETYHRLGDATNGSNIYRRLAQLFQQADDRYNSGLFHFQKEKDRQGAPDEMTLGLAIDDGPLKTIIKHLYYPDCPYEFSVLPAEILGHVYEQFLGKVIRLTKAGHAKIEEKPEVKKAGGVYYTPKYIVDYIVENTVGKLVGDRESGVGGGDKKAAGMTPKQAAKLRILDPACGSGSFLIGAYQYLLDWHRDWYTAHEPEKKAKGRNPKLYHGQAGDWRLTTAEKKRILLNNIYGVDIDSQAVEVTKLSLLLKVLEGESQETISNQLRLFHERALPDLSTNIKCGNSLIGSDFYQNKQMGLFDDDELYRINAFDWEEEFPDICRGKDRGFDAVFGNPPWGADIDKEIEYYHHHYPRSTRDHTDSFKLFIDRAVALAAPSGLSAMIVPNPLLQQRRLKDVRTILLETEIVSLVDLGEDVFDRVVAPSCVFVVRKTNPRKTHKVRVLNLASAPKLDREEQLRTAGEQSVLLLLQSEIAENADLEFRPVVRKHAVPTVLLGDSPELKCKDAGINYQRVKVGMQAKGKSDLGQRLLYEGEKETAHDVMYWKGSDISRYRMVESTNRYCRQNYKKFIKQNEVVRLATHIYQHVPKILFRQTADRIIATIDKTGVWFGRSIIAIVPTQTLDHRVEYFLGILNSRYFLWLYRELVHEEGRVFAQVKLSKVKQLPIRTIDFGNRLDKSRHGQMVELVDGMLSLHKRHPEAKTSHDKEVLQRQIDATDRQIDRLVYDLYDLTAAEIAIVEGATT